MNTNSVVINKDMKEKTKAEIMQEGIRSLTDFLIETDEIPSKEMIKNEYDKIIPDSWDNVRNIGSKIMMDTDDIGKQIELLIPVLPKFSYKYVMHEKIYRIAVNVDAGKNEYYFYMYCTNQNWGFEYHFVLTREDDVQKFAVTQLDPWFVYMFRHIEKKKWKSDRILQKYLPADYESHEKLYELTKNLFYSEDEKEDIEEMLMDVIDDFQYLMVYMNHQIELEVLKREELKAKEKDSTKFTDEEKSKRIENKIIYHENGKKEKHQILLGDMKIHIASKSGTKASKLIHRKCLCWGVRGHKRFYKSGKVVYIKPYKKGRDKDKIAPVGKEYSIVGV